MKPGDAVRHPVLGDGAVISIASRGGDAGAEVDFGYMREWVSWAELGLADLPEMEANPPESETLPNLPCDVVDARRAIVALRLGQMLEENVLDLSVGTAVIQEALRQAVIAVAGRETRGILFKGSYGSGKTHLLTMLAALASRHGLASASVTLDGEGVTLCEPMGLMEALLGSLRYPGEAAPCRISQRFGSLRRRSDRSIVKQRVGLIAEAILQTPLGAFDEPEVVDVLEDYFCLGLSATQARDKLQRLGYGGFDLPKIKAWRVDERAERFCELLRCWAEFCAATGAKGLVVVFDEVDVEYGSTLGDSMQQKKNRRRRRQLLEMLGEFIGPHENVPLLLAFGSAPASGNVGVSNDAVIDLKQHIPHMDEIEAPQPNLEQMCELGSRLQHLYTRAYPELMSQVDQPETERLITNFAELYENANLLPTTRGFVRGTIERLDIVADGASIAQRG